MGFSQAMKNEANLTLTENGQTAFRSTNFSTLLDLFATAGALRSRPDQEIISKFRNAVEENPLLALRLLFYVSDIREGLGERKVGRLMLREMANLYPKAIAENLGYIPEFGRWDSIYCLKGTKVDAAVQHFILEQFNEDLSLSAQGKPISLMAKWLKQPGADRNLALWTAKAVGLSERSYRKAVAHLRAQLNLVETNISKKEYDNIVYSHVPSKAMLKYRKLFWSKDETRFGAFIEGLKKGTEKINSSVLYPYDLVEKYTSSETLYRILDGYNPYGKKNVDSLLDEVVEAQWKALPNYIEGNHNVVVMADTSGSMWGRPIASALGLAIYFAERNQGAYHNTFMTFTTTPSFITLSGTTLLENVSRAAQAEWNGSTNLAAAMKEILRVARKNNVSPSEMPEALVVISDMEIDSCTRNDQSFHSALEKEFAYYGYRLPTIVYWNVDSRKDTFLVDGNRPGTILVSGQSASTFKHVLSSLTSTPYEVMLKVLNSERYQGIKM